MQQKIKWFSLVELVVVATILAILWTVWFVSYTWYINWVRDANRLTQLEQIRSGLQIYATKAKLPQPTESVTIRNWTEILWYQWYAWAAIIESIGLQKAWTDPLDDTYFTYYLNKEATAFQLLGFLEEWSELSSHGDIVTSTYALDYANRYPVVTGAGLWIIVWTGTELNVPIQEIDNVTVTQNSILDIWATAQEYTAIVKNDYSITGDSNELSALQALANSSWFIAGNCKELVSVNSGLVGRDGKYLISPNGTDKIEVYCDMTEDGWWWTLYSAKATYGYSNSSMQENSILKEYLDFWEFMWIFTSPSWTVASYRYKFFNKEEGKRAFVVGTWTSYDNALWWDDASIHYSSPWELASAVNITYHDTTGTTTNELQWYIAWDTDTFFSWWRRSSNNQVWLWMMTYGMYYHGTVRNNYLWFPHTRYNGTWRVWWDTFTAVNTWTDGRSASIWLR